MVQWPDFEMSESSENYAPMMDSGTPLFSDPRKQGGGLIGKIDEISKIFRAFGADLGHFSMFLEVFGTKTVVFTF